MKEKKEDVSHAKWRNIKRAQARKKAIQDLVLLLNTLPAPFGTAAQQSCRQLQAWQEDAHITATQHSWSEIPRCCDPVQLLDSEANQFRRKGLSFEEHMALLSFGNDNGKTYPEVQAASDPEHSETPGSEAKTDASTAPAPSVLTYAQLEVQRRQLPLLRIPRAPGKVMRGLQKRWQVDSFALVLRHLIHAEGRQCPLHVVDFGAGTGALLLPLAHLFPQCKFTGVEMKPAATKIMEHRAVVAQLTNVHCWTGMIEAFDQPFDIALALHACGNATDYALQLAAHHRAAFLVSPCCVGKLKFSLHGGSSFSAIHTKWGATGKCVDMSIFDLDNGKAPSSPREQRLQDRDIQLTGSAHAPQRHEAPHGSQNQQQLVQSTEIALHAADQAAQPPHLSQHGAEHAQDGLEQDSSCAEGVVGPYGLALKHPRSMALLACLPSPVQQFELLASVADTIHSATEAKQQPQSGLTGTPAMRKKQKLRLFQRQQQQQHSGQQQQNDHHHQQQQQGQQASQTSKENAPQTGLSTGEIENSSQGMLGLLDEKEELLQGEAQGPTETPAEKTAAAAAEAKAEEQQCRLCKLTVELDRVVAAQEAGYVAGLFSMLHADEMAKGDLLVGVPSERAEWVPLHRILSGSNDIADRTNNYSWAEIMDAREKAQN